MADFRADLGQVGRLEELEWLAGGFVYENYRRRLVANQAEVVEVLKVHYFLAHFFINFIMLIR